ncbi:hypothetical protein A2397_03810 [Candidatus Amesbacteria bacterium RIFOXYB1_FULL_44_23]|uniref:Uncharacterized protein n=1 Tax=Candidatus Amesbacteria bacterium RIFOXYB1_FULL_44_23 TaxID=1797263 RepID=A0A1F4ZUT0_9BACT|nr:MAG: hypothetical protein A2397_03810 [Candidatus Amesbacteria bacterium RIFOXYB1_FULL_44_23]
MNQYFLLSQAPVDLRDELFWTHPNISPAFRSNTSGISNIIGLFLPNIIIMAGVYFVGLIVYGGYQLIVYGGQYNPAGRVQKAKNSITYGLIGLLLVISAYFILQIVSTITGINLINPPVT